MPIAWNLAKRDLRTALRSELATVAVMLPCQIEKCGSAIHECPGRRQGLTRGTVIEVACRLIAKVAAREGAVISLRPVEHRDMRRDTLLLDEPVQHRSRTIGGIGRESLGLETEALLRSFDHGLRRTDLGLANGARGLNVNDDTELHVDEVIVGISEECRALVSSGPLGRRIGWRDELWDDVACGAPRRIIQRRQILLDRTAGALRIAVLVPVLTAIDRCLLASAWIRLASTAKPSPPTRPDAIHLSTTRSKTRRKTSQSRKRQFG